MILKVNNIELDIDEIGFFPINYSQADAKNPSKRKRDSTKTFILPGTKKNNTFFSSAYDLNIVSIDGDLTGFNFDPTLRYPAVVLKNGNTILRGGFSLNKVITKQDVTNGRINEFHCVIYSEVADWFQSLGDLLISELGWSDYDHILNVTNIQASWIATPGTGYWYPLVNYGYADNPLEVLTNQLRVHVYFIEIIKKCLAVSGLTISSTLINSTLFKRIVFGSGGGDTIAISPTEVAERRVNYTADGTRTFNISPTEIGIDGLTSFFAYYNYTDSFPITIGGGFITFTLISDDLLQFNEVAGEVDVANSGTYNISGSGVFPITYSYDQTLAEEFFNLEIVMRLFKNEAVISESWSSITTDTAGTTNATFDINETLVMNASDTLRFDVRVFTVDSFARGTLAPLSTLSITVDLNNTFELDFQAINENIIDGDTVDVARFLPEMKASDFMNDVITLFNLYISDPNHEGVVVIESMDDYFYETDDVDNWSDKIQRKQDIEIEPASNIEGKTYRFRFAEDRDYYKQLYFDQFGEDYGDYDYEVPSTFKKGDKVYQTKMAQSVPVQIEGSDIIMPCVYKINPTSLVTTPHKGKPRFFFNNGLVSGNWSLINSDTGAVTALTSYPQAHHLDDLTTPTLDLNFGVPKKVFYAASAYTTNNLFTAYNYTFIRQITGRDSKLVNAWFKLNESDFYNNFMRRLVNIDGVLYRKNLVKDYIANSNQLVKVELLRIVEGRSSKDFQTALPEVVRPKIINVGNVITGVPAGTTSTVSTYVTFYPIDTTSGNVVMTLNPTALRPGWIGEFKIVSGANNLNLTPSGGATIDGLATALYNTALDSIVVRFTGTDFYII